MKNVFFHEFAVKVLNVKKDLIEYINHHMGLHEQIKEEFLMMKECRRSEASKYFKFLFLFLCDVDFLLVFTNIFWKKFLLSADLSSSDVGSLPMLTDFFRSPSLTNFAPGIACCLF